MRHFCITDFWTFFQFAYGARLNPKGERWIDDSIHEPMCRWFQKHVDEWLELRREGRGEQKHLMVVIPRELGKTTTITTAGQLWLHLRDPEMSSFTGAESLALSTKMLDAMKSVLDGSDPYAMFPRMFGNWSTAARSWSQRLVKHSARKNTARADPSLGTFAVETSIVGAHPDAIFYDDPISYERLATDTNWLETVNNQITSLMPVLQSDGLFVRVGTRYDDEDDIGRAIADEGVISLDGMDTDSITVDAVNGKWHVYFLTALDEEGNPAAPKVWPEKRLFDYKRRDPLRYAAQVLNDPAISEFNPITKAQIEQCFVNKEDVPWSSLRFAIMCDTAFSSGDRIQRKDETVMVVHGYPRNGSGDVYVIEGHGSNAWRAEDFSGMLVATVQRYRRKGFKVFAITDERYASGGKQGSWQMALRNRFSNFNEPMPEYKEFSRFGTTKKGGGDTNRLVTAASFWVDGHVRVVRGAPGVDRLTAQMSKIGQYMVNNRIKIDWADAHADAFHPDIYQPMRRKGTKSAPYDDGAEAMPMRGMRVEDFGDDEYQAWRHECPREPLR